MAMSGGCNMGYRHCCRSKIAAVSRLQHHYNRTFSLELALEALNRECDGCMFRFGQPQSPDDDDWTIVQHILADYSDKLGNYFFQYNGGNIWRT